MGREEGRDVGVWKRMENRVRRVAISGYWEVAGVVVTG